MHFSLAATEPVAHPEAQRRRTALISPPSCTIVICTRHRPDVLGACLSAISALDYARFDVLVVDNSLGDGETRAVAEDHGTRYKLAPVEGLSRARNAGARAATGELVAYLDDDALPDPGWLRALAAEFDDPAVMAVAGDVRPMSLETEAERLHERVTGLASLRGRRRVIDRATRGWFETVTFGGIGLGANMAFRRAAFDVWAGFDERLGYGTPIGGGEEHDAFFRLISAGHRVVYTPAAVVRHPHPRTMAEARAKHLRTLASSSAYLTRLFIEAPGFRWATLVATARWLIGASLAECRGPRRDRLELAPPHLVLGALAAGPIRYARSRRPWSFAA